MKLFEVHYWDKERSIRCVAFCTNAEWLQFKKRNRVKLLKVKKCDRKICHTCRIPHNNDKREMCQECEYEHSLEQTMTFACPN